MALAETISRIHFSMSAARTTQVSDYVPETDSSREINNPESWKRFDEEVDALTARIKEGKLTRGRFFEEVYRLNVQAISGKL